MASRRLVEADDWRRQFLVLLLCLAPAVSAYRPSSQLTNVVESSVYFNGDWLLLTEFCFAARGGSFDFSVNYPVNYGVQQLLIYPDYLYEEATAGVQTCSEKKSVLSNGRNQIIDLDNTVTADMDSTLGESRDSHSAGCTVYQHYGEDYFNCTGSISLRGASERHWYFVLARCEPCQAGRQALKLRYKLSLDSGFTSTPTGACYVPYVPYVRPNVCVFCYGSANERSLSLPLLAFSMVMMIMTMMG